MLASTSLFYTLCVFTLYCDTAILDRSRTTLAFSIVDKELASSNVMQSKHILYYLKVSYLLVSYRRID